MKAADVVILGGGIAGLSAAWSLARAGGRRVVLLEREEVLASHSSGRNAAIFRQLDGSPGGVELAVQSRKLLDPLMASRGGWLQATGALFVARSPAGLQKLLSLAEAHGVAHTRLDGSELLRRVPALQGSTATFGFEVPGDGVMDIHGICQALADEARAAGASIRLRTEASRILAVNGQVDGVLLAGGERITAGEVVLAAGAWASELSSTAHAALELAPMRRHVAQLDAVVPVRSPVVWCVDDEAYFRPESGGTLASPCDEDPYPPCLPPEAPHARELLAEKLSRLAPSIAQSGVRRGWACLRTFAKDRAMVIGPDPRVAGLHWFAGLGGHGMTAGVAAGELLAAGMKGERSKLLDALSPARLLR